MYQYYDITLQGTDSLTLTYKLEQHRPAQVWAKLIDSAKVTDLRPTLDPWLNFDTSLLVPKIKQLESLIEKLNTWLPEYNKIKGKWNYYDHQESVNQFHIHFPEQEKNETDPIKKAQLAEYNDLIHDIESLAHSEKFKKYTGYILVCPDGGETIELEDRDFSLFKARRTFGELCLHYCHVGRHPYELYAAGDFDCPEDQIVPQTLISSFHTLRFYNDEYMEHWHKGRFKEFYQRSTLKNVMSLDDPKLAFGYISMGKLVNSEDQSKLLEKVMQCSKIINWKVY